MREPRTGPAHLTDPRQQRIFRGPAQWSNWPALHQALLVVVSGSDQQAQQVAEFVLEEWFVNLCSHGQNQAGRVLQAWVYWRSIGRGWELFLVDDGAPFDPTSIPPADTRAPLAERGQGGLGIHLTLKLTQASRYERVGEFNAWWLSWNPN